MTTKTTPLFASSSTISSSENCKFPMSSTNQIVRKKKEK
jgi:hypothetical protein